MIRKDFSNRTTFPGTTGNKFDELLHQGIIVERFPNFLYAILLFGLAAISTYPRLFETLFLWSFFLMDWMLLAALPTAKKSFGPPKPPSLVLALLRLAFSFLPGPYNFLIQGIGTALVFYGFWIEPHRIHVSHEKLTSNKFNDGFHLKILHLGDLHLERETARERQLNEAIAKANPDLILFSGDFLNLSYLRDPKSWADVRNIVREWSAPMGVYAVSGSPAVDLEDVIPAQLADLPIQFLPENRITLEHQNQAFDLVGMSCTHKPHVDSSRLASLVDSRSDRFTILLYHSPDLAPDAADLNIDLQLSGHTHGGQVCLPLYGAIFTGALYGKQFESGRMKINDLVLYITRGIGMEGACAPRVRFLCPPEITLWEISGEKLQN